MGKETFLKKLGTSETDRLVIIHADDVGMCQAGLTAFAKLWDFGTISSGAVMTPCPWFPAAAAFCREHPEVDMGVHATLNSEWHSYRWGALSTVDPQSGLLDEEGYLHRSSQGAFDKASSQAVALEIKAQIQRAIDGGIDITHIDSHMGTVFHPKFIQSYVGSAIEQRIPVMQPRATAVGIESMGATPEILSLLSPLLDDVEGQGFPLIDGVMMMPLDQPEGQLELAKKMLASVPAGITHFILHPAEDTPELRAICPDWPSRVANFRTFMDPDLKKYIQNLGIQLIGYRSLRNIIRRA